MTLQEALNQYNDWKFRLSAYEMALSIINIDRLTVAPSDGAAYRDERTAFLSGELFSIQTDPQILPVLKQLKDSPAVDADLRREASLYFKETTKLTCIPKEEFVAFRKASDASYDAWMEAREKNDYAVFEPHLLGMIEWQKKLFGYRNDSRDVYDQMLDEYEPGTDRVFYDSFFTKLRERIVPLIQKVVQSEPIDTSFLKQSFPVELQKKWTETVLLPYLGFDRGWGYQNETEHPFTSWTCENDCRTTTRYEEQNLISSIFSTIHEVGHAWYEHNISSRYDGSILSSGVSSGMHESQSRLCENYLGRTLPFWKALYPSLQETFPEQLRSVSLEQFVRAVNASFPSAVRTEADELTYPLHIMIRYEIERGLFDGTLSAEHLDETWNRMYRELLGVEVKNAKEGILQDVHWSDGSFGYFPTYALGSAFAAQFMHKMRQEIAVDHFLERREYTSVMAWLRKNIHTYGARYDAPGIMKLAAGEEFDPGYYLDYLETKYSRLYYLESSV